MEGKTPHPNRRRLDALIFDLGNTLIYFDGHLPEVLLRSEAALIHSLRSAGLRLDEQAFLQEFRARLERYYAERESEFIEYTTAYLLRTLLAEWGHPHLPEALLRQALAEMYAVTQQYWLPEADALPVLQDLKSRGFRLGLISNASDDADVQTLIDKAALRPYFEVILTSAALGVRKPNPRIFHTALAALGAPPERAAMVGDTLGADILGAHNAGMFSIWITRRADNPANRAHLGTIRPDAVIATLSELPGLLASLSA